MRFRMGLAFSGRYSKEISRQVEEILKRNMGKDIFYPSPRKFQWPKWLIEDGTFICHRQTVFLVLAKPCPHQHLQNKNPFVTYPPVLFNFLQYRVKSQRKPPLKTSCR